MENSTKTNVSIQGTETSKNLSFVQDWHSSYKEEPTYNDKNLKIVVSIALAFAIAIFSFGIVFGYFGTF